VITSRRLPDNVAKLPSSARLRAAAALAVLSARIAVASGLALVLAARSALLATTDMMSSVSAISYRDLDDA